MGEYLCRGCYACPFQDNSSFIEGHLTLNSHLWLQEAVVSDSGLTLVNRFGWRAKPGEGLKSSGDAYPSMQRLDPAERAEENDLVPTVMKVATASGAQKAQQGTTDIMTIHCIQGSPRSRQFSIPLDPGFYCREWNRPCAPTLLLQTFPT